MISNHPQRGDSHFYPRSPCGERRTTIPNFGRYIGNFYPRSPCGERLMDSSRAANCQQHFYPRSPCGERRQVKQTCRAKISISIHALLAESDNRYGRPIDVQLVFLSTLSLRRATPGKVKVVEPGLVFLSTLSLRRATFRHCTTYLNCSHFYPRSPCGERRRRTYQQGEEREFLSTLSLRRATNQSEHCERSK